MSNNAFKVNQSLLLKPNTAAPVSPQNGELYYNSTTNKFQFRQNGAWSELGSGGSALSNPDQLMIQNFESAVLTDFTQTGLNLVTTPLLNGTKTAQLIHQAAVSQSFKQIIPVNSFFRGRSLTMKYKVRSSATTGNVTITITNETAGTQIGVTSAPTLTSTTISATTTNTSPTLTNVSLTDFNKLVVGMNITGAGIQTGTTITALNNATYAVTLSANAVASATITAKVSGVAAIQSLTFDVPSTCLNISYTVTGLQEAGLPETYIDDVEMVMSTVAKTSTSIVVPKNNNTEPINYVPTGSLTSNVTYSGTWYRDGKYLHSTVRITLTGVNTQGSVFVNLPPSTGSIDLAYIDTSEYIGEVRVTDLSGAGAYVGNATYGSPTQVAALVYQASGAAIVGDNVSTSANRPMTYAAGDLIIINYKVPIAGWFANETETKQIDLTSSVIQTQPDTALTMANGSLSGTQSALDFTNVVQSVGSGIRYDASTRRFIATEAGIFNASVTDESASASANTVSIVANIGGVDNTISIDDIVSAQQRSSASASAYLNIGDYFRFTASNSRGTGGGRIASISKSGSSKILNPSSDQKIDIPTHELKLFGCSSRGSVDTGILKFDNLVKIKGDAWDLVNTVANGTVVTMKKAGKLTITSSVYYAATSQFWLTKNLQTLTTGTNPSGTDVVLASIYATTGLSMGSMSACIDVVVGDKIRIYGQSNPAAETANNFSLSLMETSVQVALSNVLPQFTDSDTFFRLKTQSGLASTVTQGVRFSNVLNSEGIAISYTDDAALGATFEILEAGLFDVSAVIRRNGSVEQGECAITVNASTNVVIGTTESPTSVIARASCNSNTNDTMANTASTQVKLAKGDKVRVQIVRVTGTSVVEQFSISKVGKPNLTSVDVTPFVNMKLPDTNIVGEVIAYAGINVPENFLSCNGAAVSRSLYSSLFNTIGTSHGSGDGLTTFNLPDYRGRFLRGVDGTAGLDPDKASRTAMNTGGNTGNSVGSVQSDQFASHSHGVNVWFSESGLGPNQPNIQGYGSSGPYASGSTVAAGGNETRPENAYVNYIIRHAPNPTSLVTPTQQVSSDTMALVNKGSAVNANDAIGTYAAYIYVANTNNTSFTTVAQSNADINLNGFRLYSRAYNVNGTTGQPNRFDIQIGKFLSTKEIQAYQSPGKIANFSTSYAISNPYEFGTFFFYEPTTGILTIDGGSCQFASTTLKYLSSNGSVSNAYFTIKASVTPSLVSIPTQNPRIARISETQNSGTVANGSIATSYSARVLNTLIDPYGIIKNPGSFTGPGGTNTVFELDAGTYDIEGPVTWYSQGVSAIAYQTRIRNTTDGVTVTIGNGMSRFATAADNNLMFVSGTFTITKRTTFQLQDISSGAVASPGRGPAPNIGGDYEKYSDLKITQIK